MGAFAWLCVCVPGSEGYCCLLYVCDWLLHVRIRLI